MKGVALSKNNKGGAYKGEQTRMRIEKHNQIKSNLMVWIDF